MISEEKIAALVAEHEALGKFLGGKSTAADAIIPLVEAFDNVEDQA